jgi:hypothetical protein
MSVGSAVEWVPLESSVFTAVAYRVGAQQLYLRFHEGYVYRFFACPRSVYKELLATESKGRYFAQHIRNGFRCERVRENHAGGRVAHDNRDLCTAEQLLQSILLAKACAIQKRDVAHAAGRAVMNPLDC